MIVDGIHENYRVDAFQRSLLPFFCDGKDLVSNAAYRGIRDFHAVDILDMLLDVTSGHALGVHGQDLFLNVLANTGLVFLQHLGLKFAFPVARHGHLNITEAGSQRLTAVSVAAIVRVFVFVVIPAVAQLIIQLCFRAVFHKLGNSFLEQTLNILHTADVCHLQQFTDLCSTGFFFRASILSRHIFFLHPDASILHLSGGLHNYWDGLTYYVNNLLIS